MGVERGTDINPVTAQITSHTVRGEPSEPCGSLALGDGTGLRVRSRSFAEEASVSLDYKAGLVSRCKWSRLKWQVTKACKRSHGKDGLESRKNRYKVLAGI